MALPNQPGVKLANGYGAIGSVTLAQYKAQISKVAVSGPKKVKKGKKATYKIRVSNSGREAAKNVRVKIAGRGIRSNKFVGSIAAGSTRTVKVKLRPKKKGKIKTTFKVTSGNAGNKTVKKTIRVK